MRSLRIGSLVLLSLGGGAIARPVDAGLPGYFEWVLWEETESVRAGASQVAVQRTFRWVVGPYARQVDCETDRDRLTVRTLPPHAGLVTRLVCVPDTVNPREDPRWQ